MLVKADLAPALLSVSAQLLGNFHFLALDYLAQRSPEWEQEGLKQRISQKQLRVVVSLFMRELYTHSVILK